MLLAKLLLVSSRIAAETLAGRCFGPAVAAWLTSTLIVVGPIVVVLALEQGASFAVRSAEPTPAGVVSLSAFRLACAVCCTRIAWPAALARLTFGAASARAAGRKPVGFPVQPGSVIEVNVGQESRV